MIYRIYDEDGTFITEGVGGASCCIRPFVPKMRHFRLCLIWDLNQLSGDIDKMLAASSETDKLRVQSEGISEGEVKEARMKILEMWASLATDPELKSHMLNYLYNSFTECEESLYSLHRYGSYGDLSADNTIHDKHEMLMELRIPSHMSRNITWTLIRAVDEYIKCRTIALWSMDVLPEKADLFTSRCTLEMEKLATVVKHRNVGRCERNINIL